MKRILIITINKRLLLYLALYLVLSVVTILTASTIHFTRYSQAFRNNDVKNIKELEKENSKLKDLFSSFILKDQKIIYEDEPLPSFPLSKVIAEGVETKFRILSDDLQYLRPLYDPDWKGAYFRGWLYLPHKNIEARHRIFAFSLGLSMNYDIFGSLGFSPSVIVDAHKNINFLIYGFHVNSIKVFQNQVALVGEPMQIGAQIISIVQNDLLPEGVDTKDFLFQLSTPKGYEVDFLKYNIIRYEYLMKQIKEHTAHPSFAREDESKALEKLLKENAVLKQELSFFIPYNDEAITQQNCYDMFNNQDEIADLSFLIKQGREIPFSYNYKNPQYKRPLYDPLWKTNYKRKWCYIPKQIELNLHKLLTIPQNRENQYDFFGTLGFHEDFKAIKSDQYGFHIYNFVVSKAIVYKNQLFFIGVPSRTGVEIVTINHYNMKDYKNYLVRLVTPDNSEIDCTIFHQ